MVNREFSLIEDGKEYYKGKLPVNCCRFYGRIYKDIQAPSGRAPAKFTITVSNGKKKDSDEWLPSTFVNCLAWGDLGQQIADRYHDGDNIELIAKYQTNSYNGRKYSEFVVRDVVGIKDAEPDNPYPNGNEPVKDSGNSEKVPTEDDLPF